MNEYPDIDAQQEPPHKRMTLEEYNRFCEYSVQNNPHITAANCIDRKTGEEEIKVPFRL